MPTFHPKTTYGWTTDKHEKGLQGYLYKLLWSATAIKILNIQNFTQRRGFRGIRIFLLVAASCSLSGLHPTACVARRRLAARRRTTRILGSQRQSQCALMTPGGASRSCSFALPLGLGGWSLAAAPCCTRGARPCAAPGLFGSRRGIATFESWDDNTGSEMVDMIK